ncbi:chemotaxis-specific protein-glutamate methyltransferase CheB [Paracrocinitomix mangrovi]|nr:chemotaxis-specific protein-glutamate methyltransferase CheB [Paracrocinitomix mangrovi]
MRLIISDIINSEPGLNVVGTALDGKEAVEVVVRTKPDVVLMDMNMGEYDGLYGVKHILEKYKVPIIILSAVGNTNLEPVLEALRLGAFDYLNKPVDNKAKVRAIDHQIIEKIKTAALTNNKHFSTENATIKRNTFTHTFDSNLNYHVIVIGASTGGPTALERVITKLPENLPIPVIIAQHMPANFIPSFAKRLDGLTPLRVKIGYENEEILPGNIYLAPGDRNMIVKRNLNNKVVIGFTQVKYPEYNNPSINALMLSANEVYKNKTIGVVLTGMGKDGANGLSAIYKSGGYTIGQDKTSSVVYGMPKEVAERGVIHKAVSIHEMAGFIVSCLS